MAEESHKAYLLDINRFAEQRAEITRNIAQNVGEMDDTVAKTREVIADSRQAIRAVDRLLSGQ